MDESVNEIEKSFRSTSKQTPSSNRGKRVVILSPNYADLNANVNANRRLKVNKKDNVAQMSKRSQSEDTLYEHAVLIKKTEVVSSSEGIIDYK